VGCGNGAGERTLLSFAICKPERRTAGDPPVAGVRIKATLVARGRTLWYTKTAETGPAPPGELYEAALVRNVERVEISTSPAGDDPTHAVLLMRVRCVNQAFPQSAVEQETKAKVEVATRTL
jgi:hypothetical protein